MIKKTISKFKRRVKTNPGQKFNDAYHIERVLRETWWLFWIIPMYSRDTIEATNI